jgi:CheY-like chemotaxis protein
MTPEESSSILVVDDEPSLRKVIRASLASGGFAVEEAGTGADAVALLQRRAFELFCWTSICPG